MTKDLKQNYELIQQIGCGTYGKVYKARDIKTQEIVAAKRVHCAVKPNEVEKRMSFLMRERNILMEMVTCANVVKILDCFDHRVPNAIQMDMIFEYCPFDLGKVIKNARIEFRIDEVKCFLRQILNGLAFMHEKQVIHRDMKTDNILLTTQGVVKIADFGLSRKLAEAAGSAQPKYTNMVVTLWYRAPEILLGDTGYDERIDMWSFGCIMAEFWTRSPILCGDSEASQLKQIFQLCGAIDPKSWPSVVKLKLFDTFKIPGTFSRRTRTYLSHGMPNQYASNMFDTLLMYDPSQRHSAWSALNDDFFFTDPLPVRDLFGFMKRSVAQLFPEEEKERKQKLQQQQEHEQKQKQQHAKGYRKAHRQC